MLKNIAFTYNCTVTEIGVVAALPAAAYYKPRNRYRANIILDYLNKISGYDKVILTLAKPAPIEVEVREQVTQLLIPYFTSSEAAKRAVLRNIFESNSGIFSRLPFRESHDDTFLFELVEVAAQAKAKSGKSVLSDIFSALKSAENNPGKIFPLYTWPKPTQLDFRAWDKIFKSLYAKLNSPHLERLSVEEKQQLAVLMDSLSLLENRELWNWSKGVLTTDPNWIFRVARSNEDFTYFYLLADELAKRPGNVSGENGLVSLLKKLIEQELQPHS